MSHPFCPTDLSFCTKQELIEQLLAYSNRNIALLVSESSIVRYEFQNLIKQLSNTNHVTWIKQINPNPTQEDLLTSLKLLEEKPVDLIIAMGGGSSIDLAKGISAFHSISDRVSSLELLTQGILQKYYTEHSDFIDIIAIPTTAGTGSELTQWGTFWDHQGKMKYSIDHAPLLPVKAIIVPELTLTLTPLLTLSTGLDALSHAMEAYWSKHTSPLVQDISYRAIQLILEYLPLSIHSPENFEYRERLCRASALAGMSFSHTRTTACHSISYPLTMLYHIPHGIAVAMTLGAVSHRNKGYFPNSEDLFNLFREYGGLQPWLDQVSHNIAELRLSNYHIKPSDLEQLVLQSFTNGRMDNNPVNFNKEDILEILQQVY